MDDFFLLPQDRTPERLAKPGENVDHERFDREVLSPLCHGQTAVYRPGSAGPAALARLSLWSQAPSLW